MAILRNLPANIVSEIGVKVQFATHEEWRQNLGNGLLIFLVYLSLPNLYFCTIRSMIMFLKVLNKVNIKTLIQP